MKFCTVVNKDFSYMFLVAFGTSFLDNLDKANIVTKASNSSEYSVYSDTVYGIVQDYANQLNQSSKNMFLYNDQSMQAFIDWLNVQLPTSLIDGSTMDIDYAGFVQTTYLGMQSFLSGQKTLEQLRAFFSANFMGLDFMKTILPVPPMKWIYDSYNSYCQEFEIASALGFDNKSLHFCIFRRCFADLRRKVAQTLESAVHFVHQNQR